MAFGHFRAAGRKMAGNIDKLGEGKTGRYAELPVRIASAIVLAAFALFCTWMGGQTFLLLAIVLSVVILAEFTSMVKSRLPVPVALFALGFLVLVFAAYILERQPSGLVILALGCVALAVWEILIRQSIWGATALAYSALPFVALVEMRNGTAGLFIILFVFACVWGADTFAYFFGKTLGGPKLAPSVSPNKTWSGFIGGFIGAITISCLLELVFGYPIGIGAIFLAAYLALASQIGDLFESWIKRRFGHKDSGRIIPGHGGLLDRIDGLIFAIIAAWLLSLSITQGGVADSVLSDSLLGRFVTGTN